MDFLASLPEWLSPGRLLEDPRSVESAAYVNVAVVLVLVGILGALLAGRPQLFSQGNALHERLMTAYGNWLVWLSAFGVLATIVRYANAPFFSKRIWVVLDLLAILGIGVHFAWYRYRRYPGDLQRYQQVLHQRRFRLAAQPRPRRVRAARRR